VGVLLVLAVGAAVVVALRHDPKAKLPTTNGGPPATILTALPAVAGPLTSGTYTTGAFGPSVRFHVDDGWSLASAVKPNHLELTRADTSDAVVTLQMIDEVIDPAAAPGSGDDVNPLARPLPADLVAWLVGHPRLQVSTTGPSSVGGTGAYVDFTVAHGYGYANRDTGNPCARWSCVMLFRTLDRPDPSLMGAVGGQLLRYYLVPQGNRYLAIAVAAPATDYPRFSAEAQKVLATLGLSS
jgi:hypothetical protein